MRMTILGFRADIFAAIAALATACAIGGCGSSTPSLHVSETPLTPEAVSMLGRKGMDAGAPIFVRIFKEESELEVWKARDDGRFYHFKTYPICNWSGELGPKTTTGDKQAVEGFYRVGQTQMNPNSQYYLAFNLGYPNAFDRSHGRTGSALMVHGKCKSVGCYAMTDALMEEIYSLAREAFRGGQEAIEVHAFPFRMTPENMQRHQNNPNMLFWQTLRQGYDFFEAYRFPPTVAVCERSYVVNVKLPANASIRPDGMCPRFERPIYEPFTPRPFEQQIADERITAVGPKTRQFATVATPPSPIAAESPAITFGPSYGLGAPMDTGSTGTAFGFSE